MMRGVIRLSGSLHILQTVAFELDDIDVKELASSI